MEKRKNSRKNTAPDGINYGKLFFETMFVLTAVFGAFIAALYPILREYGAFRKDKFEAYRHVLDEVDGYDYSAGRDTELEKRLDDVYYNDEEGLKVYVYAMARGTYYCNLGMYNTANAAFSYLEEVASPNTADSIEFLTRKVLCERKQANHE